MLASIIQKTKKFVDSVTCPKHIIIIIIIIIRIIIVV
jgi:hypothetical protein